MVWIRRLATALAIVMGIAAVLKEAFQPRGLRVGEGRVFGVPYSLRRISIDDLRQRYWNPEGALLAPPLLGVGVMPNIPAILSKAGLWTQ